jgi:hypothetical protein
MRIEVYRARAFDDVPESVHVTFGMSVNCGVLQETRRCRAVNLNNS